MIVYFQNKQLKKNLKEELPEKKRKVKHLYIDIDEDYPSLKNGRNKRNKIIYVYIKAK